jgi:hypothetical protein
MLLHATPLPRNTDDLGPFDDSGGADSEMALEHCCCWSDAKGNKYVFKKSPCSSDILLPSPHARIELVNLCVLLFPVVPLFAARNQTRDTRLLSPLCPSGPLSYGKVTSTILVGKAASHLKVC